MASSSGADADAYVGLFMLEQPPDWWLPPGFTLRHYGSAPLQATDPAGSSCFIYPIPGYRPSPQQVETVAKVIRRELGPVPDQGLDPGIYRAVGADRNTPLGLINQAILYPFDKLVLLLHLASYGIDASIVGGTQTAAHMGWVSETSAGQLRRDLNVLAIVLGIEGGRTPEMASSGLRNAAPRVAAMSRAAARASEPILLRTEQASGLPYGRTFQVVDVVEADPVVQGTAIQGRTVHNWRTRMRAGRAFDDEQGIRYDFNQVYVLKDNGKGYWILDSYGPRDGSAGAGPVSRKFTQLADIQVESARSMLQEAYRKYRPGQVFAKVPSRPLDLLDNTIQGQLWLEVPIQTSPIPHAVLTTARQLSIKIRDITGKVY